MFEVDEQSRLHAFICFINQNTTLHKERLKVFEHDIDHRFEQGMPGRNKLSLRLSGDQILLKRDAGIAI